MEKSKSRKRNKTEPEKKGKKMKVECRERGKKERNCKGEKKIK
jgi:hypothetical protein